ncbi:MAG: protein kinase [Acidobacteriota bacterium]
MSSEPLLLSSPPESASLERLGIYRIESLLGRGGMGEVYLAWDEMLERHVAIKRIRSDRLGDATHRARFLREARAVAQLDHPAIVRVYHVLERDDSHCLVMEYVRGQDLTKLIAGGEIDTERAMAIARGVAEGLAEAHRHGLVHRDLKPGNVMLTQDVGSAAGRSAAGRAAPTTVKILDFGLAKALAPRDAPKVEDEQLTQSGMIVGTVHAMSPEQAAGRPVDHRSDLFALGSLLYEMLSGRPPFRGANHLDTLSRIAGSQPQPLAELCPGLPRRLVHLVERLLEKDPERRPHSAERVAQELAALITDADPDTIQAAISPTGISPTGISPARISPHRQIPEDLAALADAPTEVELEAPRVDADAGSSVLRVLVVTDLVGSTQHFEQLGDVRMAELSGRHDRMARDLLARYGGLEIDKTDGFLLLFERPGDAVAYALSYHQALQRLARQEGVELAARAGVHLGEVILRRNPASHVTRGAKPLEVEGLAKPTAARVMSLAGARQTLLTRGVFDMARHAATVGELADPKLCWLDHGAYSFKGIDESLEICEIGVEGFAPLVEPPDSEKAKRAVSFSDELTLGWRPAVGQPIPRRANWQLSRRLGEGGFGEVWLARHKSGEERVFKFCFEAERLRALKREVTLFRLLRETLGHRHDIARVLDWDFEEAPYFLESEYTAGGDLVRWAESLGGLAEVPLGRRLELVAGVAEALAAAHSVGVLHKDVKPRNVLVGHDADGRPQARLTDFGIGALTEQGSLGAPNFTVQGFTDASLADGASATGGTVRYMAPELLAGKPATVQADVYSLGVVLYQVAVGDFERPLASGWRRELDDELLVEDIGACVDGDPERRLRDPAELAGRLRSLEARRLEQRAEEEAERSRQRVARRRRAAGWLGVAAAVLLLVISAFAYQTLEAKNRELEARQNAEQRRRQAEGLIDFMLGDLRSELQPLGKLELLDKVGDRAMEYFAAVPDGDLSDEETASYAQGLHQIGQVRFALGRMDEAAEAFGESLAKAQELAARDPHNVDWQFDLGQSHYWVGYARWRESDLDAALGHFEAYRQISEKLVEQDPENTTWQTELAYSYNNIGLVFNQQGRLTEAARALEAHARIFEGLSLQSPEDHALRAELADAYGKLGRVLEDHGELVQARSRFEASLELFTQAAAGSPDDTGLQHLLNATYHHVGKVLQMQGEDALALQRFRSGLAGNRRLVAHDPDHLLWRAGLSDDLNAVARILIVRGELDEAGPLLAEDGEITQTLVERAPGHRGWLFARARHLLTRARVAWLQGRPQTAVEDLEAVRATLQQLVTESESLRYRLWLALAHEQLGEAYRAAGELERAAESWHEASEVAAQLVAAKSSPWHLERLARALVLSGRVAEAKPHLERLVASGFRSTDTLTFLDRHGLASQRE